MKEMEKFSHKFIRTIRKREKLFVTELLRKNFIIINCKHFAYENIKLSSNMQTWKKKPKISSWTQSSTRNYSVGSMRKLIELLLINIFHLIDAVESSLNENLNDMTIKIKFQSFFYIKQYNQGNSRKFFIE